MGKKKEFKVKINVRLKKMTDEEYNIVAGLWKRMMLDFEERLRVNLRANTLDYKTFKDLDKKFDFASLAALKVPIPQLANAEKAQPVLDAQPQLPSAVEQATVVPKVEPTPALTLEQPVSLSKESPVPLSIPQPSVPSSEAPSFPPLSKPPVSEPGTQPSLKFLRKTEPFVRPGPGIPKAPPVEESSPKSPNEEDKVSGIVILRQQLLSELKKIRGIIETKEQ
ncbi:MAG: hypothetical protein ACE5OZ_24780 [Candidatus Heimdallarchaeota archaeon]